LASERAARRAEKEKRREEAKAARAARVSAGSKSRSGSSEKVVEEGWSPAQAKNPAEEMPVAALETSALASRGSGKKFRGQAFVSGGVPPPFLKV
jgi:hypothetical protein